MRITERLDQKKLNADRLESLNLNFEFEET